MFTDSPWWRGCCLSLIALPLQSVWAVGQVVPLTVPKTQIATRTAAGDGSREIPYLTRRSRFKTKLTKKGSSPHSKRELTPLKGYRQVTYRSGNLSLKAWVYVPPASAGRRHPAVVHFHGGFGLSNGHFHTCKPFQRAGFVVMIPALRGENGNPGTYELWLSEVDDAIAAVKWLHRQRYVDQKRVYAFGHSAGGGLSSMLSLFDDVPIQHSGSSGAIYSLSIFDLLKKSQVPFDLSNPMERRMRLLVGNVAWMKRKHYAYYGSEDYGVSGGVKIAEKELKELEAAGEKPLLELIERPGRHNPALMPSMEHYIELIRKENAESR